MPFKMTTDNTWYQKQQREREKRENQVFFMPNPHQIISTALWNKGKKKLKKVQDLLKRIYSADWLVMIEIMAQIPAQSLLEDAVFHFETTAVERGALHSWPTNSWSGSKRQITFLKSNRNGWTQCSKSNTCVEPFPELFDYLTGTSDGIAPP